MAVNNFPEDAGFSYNIVVGGHEGDPAPDQSGTCKVIDPLRHSSGIDHKELPFITMLQLPTSAEQGRTSFPPEPGTCVAVSRTTGLPTTGTVIGMPNETNSFQAVAGNQSLGHHIQLAASYATGKIFSKGSKTIKKDGAVIREVINGPEWKHELTKGLATHAAFAPLAGQIIPQIKQIDTAIKQFANIPGLDAIAQIPGQFMNLANIFKNMTNRQKSKAFQNFDQNTMDGLNSMVNLMAETDTGGMFISSGMVHIETLIENAVELFSKATSISEIIEILLKLQHDTSLHGLENLPEIEITVPGVYGNVTMTINADGTITPSANSQNAINTAISTIQSEMAGSQGGGGGNSLFGDAAKLVSEALGRIPPNIRKNILQNVITEAKKQKFDDIHKKMTQGLNPIDLFT